LFLKKEFHMPPVSLEQKAFFSSSYEFILQQFSWLWSHAQAWLDRGKHEEWTIMIVGLLSIFTIYALVRSRVQRHKGWDKDKKRTALTQTHNVVWLLAGLWIITSWAQVLFPFLISVIAVLVAFVIATKEWLLCLLGSLYRMTTGMFHVGDRITVQNMRGEVLDIQWLQTRVLELGPGEHGPFHTGRVLSFPNSLLIQHQVISETFFDKYAFQWLNVPLCSNDDVAAVKRILLEEAKKVSLPYMDEATKHMSRMQKHLLMEGPSVNPKVYMEFKAMGELTLKLRFPAPQGMGGVLAQDVLQALFDRYAFSAVDKWSKGKEKKGAAVLSHAPPEVDLMPSLEEMKPVQ
jgi:small-conductance mechanosensitive channel